MAQTKLPTPKAKKKVHLRKVTLYSENIRQTEMSSVNPRKTAHCAYEPRHAHLASNHLYTHHRQHASSRLSERFDRVATEG